MKKLILKFMGGQATIKQYCGFKNGRMEVDMDRKGRSTSAWMVVTVEGECELVKREILEH